MARRGEPARLTRGWDRTVAWRYERPAPSRLLVSSAASLPVRSGTVDTPMGEGWCAAHAEPAQLLSLGFRLELGGTHLARTMMLAELGRVMAAAPHPSPDEVNALVLCQNILQKRTGSGRRLCLRHLRGLYGLGEPIPIMRAMVALWPRAGEGQPLIALLAALAREVLLRDTAAVILSAPPGAPVRAADLAGFFDRRYSGRYTLKMLRSLSQNCASSWTQSGHLKGKVRKERARPAVSPAAVAFAALLGSLAGFGGPMLLASPWIAVLDRSGAEVLALLRMAEREGLLRLRAGGDVVEIEVRRHMASALEIPELADH
jgi:hypothetical protein